MSEPLVRSALRAIAARVYCATTDFLDRFTGKVLILTYHRVLADSELHSTFVQPGMYVTTDTFERHLKFLTAHFEMRSFQDLLDAWEGGSWDSTSRYCAITFDDGWLDNYRHAYPLLCRYRVPATVFLPTNLIGTSGWLWPDRLGHLVHHHLVRGNRAMLHEALAVVGGQPGGFDLLNGRQIHDVCNSVVELAKTLPVEDRDHLLSSLGEGQGVDIPGDRRFVDWDEVREMSDHRIAFGSHSCSHAALTRVESEQLQHELRESLAALRRQSINCVPVLGYPYGDHADTTASEARAAGYRAAVTTNPGVESPHPVDLFRLKRIGVHDDVSRTPPLMAFHLARRARAAKERG